MNGDTNELWNWISEDEEMKSALESCIGNELEFCWTLMNIITIVHNRLNYNGESEMAIDSSKVNGNEIYIEFCSLFGNEQPDWCRNENQNEQQVQK